MSSYIPCNKGGGTMGMDTEDIVALTENKYVNERGDSMKGDLSMNAHKIKELSIPTDEADAVNKKYVDSKLKALTDSYDAIKYNLKSEFKKLQDMNLITKNLMESNVFTKDLLMGLVRSNSTKNEMLTSFSKRLLFLESHASHVNSSYAIRKRAAELPQNKTLLPGSYKHFIESISVTTNSKTWSAFMVVKIIDPYFYLFTDDNETMNWFVKCDYNSRFKKGEIILAAYDLPHGQWHINTYFDKTHTDNIYKVKSKHINFKSTLVQYIDLIFYVKKIDADEVRKALMEMYKDILSTREYCDVRIMTIDKNLSKKVLLNECLHIPNVAMVLEDCTSNPNATSKNLIL